MGIFRPITRRSKLRGLIIVAGAVTVTASGFWSTPAFAGVPVSAVGWWTNAAVKPSPPKGGIAVSLDPSGSTSVAAIRIDTGAAGVSQASLQLTEAGGEGQQVATVEACPASDSWTPADGGTISDAPKASCATKVDLTRSASGVWTGNIYPLLSGKTGLVSIAVLPGPPPSGLPAGVFQLDFQPPVVQGEVVAPSTSGPVSSSPVVAAPVAQPAPTASAPPPAAPVPSAGSAPAALPSSTPVAQSSQAPAAVPAPARPPTRPAPASAPASGGGDYTATFPAAGASDSRSVSAATIAFWMAMALLIGAAAGALHWLRAEDKLPSLPWRRTNLFQPPTQ